MSSVKINGQEYSDIQIVKLQKGKADEAISKLNSAKQGADDVVFKVGEDVFVASGRGLFDGKKMAGKPFMGGEGVEVEFDGQKAEVLAWDNQANNGAECAKWVRNNGYGLPLVTLALGDMFLKVKWFWAAAAGAVAWGAAAGGAYLYGASRKMNVDELASLGTVVQQNKQPEGGWGHAIKNLFSKQ